MSRLALLTGLLLLLCAAPAHAVIGGTPAPPGRWPWMAALMHTDESDAFLAQFCGGAVIAPRKVLTAGHCVEGETTGHLAVLIGRTRLTESGGRIIKVKAISAGRGFTSGRQKGLDAAVLTLARDAGVPPLALARPGQEALFAAGTRAWMMGWGRINAQESPGGANYYADKLREAQLPIAGDNACENAVGGGGSGLPYRPAWTICVGRGDGTAGSCNGDSGGPLVVTAPGGAWVDVGIVQGGDSCAALGYYDFFARVDRISRFALAARATAQPDPVSPPRIAGRLKAGAELRCTLGGWRGDHARFAIRWTRAGSSEVIGRQATLRLTAADAARGVGCTVTASNDGGYNSMSARPLRAA